MLVGQERICNKINSCTLDTLPRTILLLGEYGSGRHSIVNYISNRFSLEIEDISDILTLETIDNITHRVEPKIYLIDSLKLTIKNENVILKFLEEPLKNSFIVIIGENRSSIIPTVLNRCQIWEMSIYDSNFLKTFVDNPSEQLIRVANTPGKMLEYQHYPLQEMFDLAHKIFSNIKSANFANVLTIGRFIAFKNEKDKFDFNLFTDILVLVCRDLFMNGNLSFDIYVLTNKLNNNKYVFNVDKKALFEHYLIELKLKC